jgi:hypothetical protein
MSSFIPGKTICFPLFSILKLVMHQVKVMPIIMTNVGN